MKLIGHLVIKNIKDTGMKFLKFKLKLLHNFFKEVIYLFLS